MRVLEGMPGCGRPVITRRQFTKAALAGVALPALALRSRDEGPVGGVRLGVQTYSFRDIARSGASGAVDVLLDAMTTCGFDECELWSPQIEASPPAGDDAPAADRARAREALRQWRLSHGPQYYGTIRQRFRSAGVTIYAYNLSFNESFTDEEIERGFEAAKALGVEVMTASSTLRAAKRLVPFAERHKMPVAMHNHSRVDDPNEFATPESFTTALAMSPMFKINLDIGHFTASNFDALAFLDRHHARITNLHVKDRRKNQGDNVSWGQGDTPIRETLIWLQQHKSPIRAYVEYEYAGTRGTLAEVSACAAYARRILTGDAAARVASG